MPEVSPGGAAPGIIDVRGERLEYRWIGADPSEAPTLVFLHEGLGSLALWRDFPDRLASDTGCGALVYSRKGYGSSDLERGPRSVHFMHREALEVLPVVLAHFQLSDFVLFGHSDGASIAIIYAGSPAAARTGRLRAMILEAPHVFVEPVCLESIARIAREYETTRLAERLARYHGANTDSMFRTWTDVWLKPEFRQWNIEEYLPAINVPLLQIQGEQDEYGTLRQVETIAARVRGATETLVLPGCGHSPHLQRPDAVAEAATRFIRQTLDL